VRETFVSSIQFLVRQLCIPPSRPCFLLLQGTCSVLRPLPPMNKKNGPDKKSPQRQPVLLWEKPTAASVARDPRAWEHGARSREENVCLF
jgi:hypothetical protein